MRSVVWSLLNKTPSKLLYFSLAASTVKVFRAVQFKNASGPMPVTLAGIVMLVRPVQWKNANCVIMVTLAGMVMLVRFLQDLKARLPMLMTGHPPKVLVMVSAPA